MVDLAGAPVVDFVAADFVAGDFIGSAGVELAGMGCEMWLLDAV